MAPDDSRSNGGGRGGDTLGPGGAPQPDKLLPSISAPKGGGAIQGIGEKFTTDAATGTGSLTIPIAVSPGRGGMTPDLALRYDSGAGNGPFGLGFHLSIPQIARKTDKGLPRYLDDPDGPGACDVFVLSGAEDLVPVRDAGGRLDVRDDGDYRIWRYRPRVEGLFARIERWRHKKTGDTHWRAFTRDNVQSIYGRSAAARIADPHSFRGERVFSWLLEETRDDRGNAVRYVYKQEDGKGVSPARASESNRFLNGKLRAGSTAQRYVKRVLYGNRAPLGSDDAPAPDEPSAWLLEVVFDYGEHDDTAPTPDEARPWTVRVDPFSTYRATFEVRTYRQCRRVLMFHRFTGPGELGPAPVLVRSTDFTYAESRVRAAANRFYDSGPLATYLAQAEHAGYLRDDTGAYTRATAPPLALGFSQPVIHDELRAIDRGKLAGVPGFGSAQWVDLDGEGVPGLLATTPGAWFYQANQGGGQLAAPALQHSLPAPAELRGGAAQLLDLDGSGQLDLVRHRPPLAGYFERTADGAWKGFVPFAQIPHVDWDDPYLRFLDLDGDGLPDVVITEQEAFRWYPSRGKDGFERAAFAKKPGSDLDGAAIAFYDGAQSIHLADMTGDGLTDLVRVRNGDVCYWPNLGYGRFGRKVTLDGSPVFDDLTQFHPGRIRLGDVDGSGTADVVYSGAKGTRVYFNRSGNALSPPLTIKSVPLVCTMSRLEVVDLLGHGTACLVWSTALPAHANRPVAYVDLLPEGKPHLLTSVTNNLGGETRLTYAPSTEFYLADKKAGRPWLTRLSFPVHVLARVDHEDHVSGSNLVTRYAYHHGFYDGIEREFRGFALVEQWDAESFAAGDPAHEPDHEIVVPPVHTKTWFHTGAWLERERLEQKVAREYYRRDPKAPVLSDTALPAGLTVREEREAARARRGQVLRREIYADDGTPAAAHPYLVTEHRFTVRLLQRAAGAAHAVFFAHPLETITLHYERDPSDPRTQHELVLDADDFGNVLRSCQVAYPRRTPTEPEQARLWATVSERTVINRVAEPRWYRIGVVAEETTSELTGLASPPGGVLAAAAVRAAIIAAVEIPFESEPGGITLQRRMIARARQIYYKDDLTGPLPLGTIESRALAYQSYKLAFTPGLLAQAYGTRIDDAVLTEGGYVSQDSLWWASSSRAILDPAQFYLPTQAIDPFGNVRTVTYDAHALLAIAATDSLGNRATAAHDYRVLAPALVTDPNGNRTETQYDALGLPIAIALLGKEGAGEGDTLADPTTRIAYDLFATPAFVHTFAREQHGASNPHWQESFTYTDGFGREVMKKVQAEPDPSTGAARWVGTGRTVFDNKGNAIKKYEPFFSATPEYESEASVVEQGVTPIFHYDPLGRVIRTGFPDGTYAKFVFDTWKQEIWDGNDAVADSTWLARMQAGTPAEQRAASLSLAHSNTPTVAHVDTLGRTFLTVADNGPDGLRPTRVALDIQGNARRATDPRGVVVATQTFDLLGRAIHSMMPDAGESRALADVASQPIRSWSARGFRHRRVYDALRRPTHLFVLPPEATTELLVERSAYGESLPAADALAANARGRAVRVFDGAGVLADAAYDFKGNLLSSTRRLATVYQDTIDWSALASVTDVAALDAVAEPQLGPASDTFTTTLTYDALNRVKSKTTPDGSVTLPTYNEANLLERLDVRLRGATRATTFVSNLDYNARGQRELVAYGNGTTTTYTHDRLTFHLAELKTTRDSSGFGLQALAYTYDAVGNIVQISDAVSFSNPNVSADGLYEYDALYQLTKATGREHPGQQPTDADADLLRLDHPEDLQALRRYQEAYSYDASGNVTSMTHVPLDGATGWTRRYAYAPDSNRLLATSLPGDDPDIYSASYSYDVHGNMTSMPHLTEMRWDHAERLQSCDRGGGGTVYFVYDASGQRIRKLYAHGALVEERIYLGGFEVYQKRNASTGEVALARETLHMMDDKARVALVETKTIDADVPAFTPSTRSRFQLDNHLGSSLLELDQSGSVITYEEYFPYGGTAFHAADSTVDVSAKRYRYNGLERDEETGLYHQGARYSAPWLGRWTSTDPSGFVDGANLFRYLRNSPVAWTDPQGTDPIICNTACHAPPSTTGFGDWHQPAEGSAGLRYRSYVAVELQELAHGPLTEWEGYLLLGEHPAPDMNSPRGNGAFRPIYSNDQNWHGASEGKRLLGYEVTYMWGVKYFTRQGVEVAAYSSNGTAIAEDSPIDYALMFGNPAKWAGKTLVSAGKGAAGRIARLLADDAPKIAVDALSDEVPPATQYVYRGIHAGHPALEVAKEGRVVPGDPAGTVTPDEHNLYGMDPEVQARSPFTSWTHDYQYALERAQSTGPGGIVLRLPTGAPPEGATWSWEWSIDKFMEQEVLLRGIREGATVVWPPR